MWSVTTQSVFLAFFLALMAFRPSESHGDHEEFDPDAPPENKFKKEGFISDQEWVVAAITPHERETLRFDNKGLKLRTKLFSVSGGGSRISQTGIANPQGGVPTYYLAKFALKPAWKWKKLDPGGGVPGAALRSTNGFVCRIFFRKLGDIGLMTSKWDRPLILEILYPPPV